MKEEFFEKWQGGDMCFYFRGSLRPEDVHVLRVRICLLALPVETSFPTLGRGETGHQQRRQLRGLRHLQVRIEQK